MRVLVRKMYPTEGGINLAADVHLPDGPGPFPVVLSRTPYNRVTHYGAVIASFVKRGYAFVAADCRGRHDSEGVFTRIFDEAVDGKATLDWIGNQSWCNGRIGLWGRSYGGVFQIPAAISGHQALKCICPSIICAHFFQDWCRYDGCFALRNPLWWVITHGNGRITPPTGHINWDELYAAKTFDEVEEIAGFEMPMLRRMIEHDSEDAYWRGLDQWPMHPKICVPGFHSAGWFDHVSRGQFESYMRISDLGATREAREGQRLLVGPWGHISLFLSGEPHRTYGIWDFGEAADYSVLNHELRFLDLYLKDIDDGISKEPPVRIFLMGSNRWLDLPDWPAPGATEHKWFLSSKGNAHGQRGDGCLVGDEPNSTAADVLLYDPRNPLPTCGGQIFWNMEPRGPQDQRHLLERDDVLFYQSDRLSHPITVIGDIGLDLTIAADVDDTDIVAKLCVVEENGSVTCLTVGSFRCRYRNGWDKRVPLAHNTPTTLDIHLSQLAYTFPRNSRIALMITSSDFPRIQPHTNTMAKPWEPVEPVVSRTQVLHGNNIASRLWLPVCSA